MARRKNRWASVLIYMMLDLGALMGVPMRPHEIEEIARRLTNAVTLVAEHDQDGDPPG